MRKRRLLLGCDLLLLLFVFQNRYHLSVSSEHILCLIGGEIWRQGACFLPSPLAIVEPPHFERPSITIRDREAHVMFSEDFLKRRLIHRARISKRVVDDVAKLLLKTTGRKVLSVEATPAWAWLDRGVRGAVPHA